MTEMVWCEHIVFDMNRWMCKPSDGYYTAFQEWLFCPICSAPKPKELSKVEKLSKALREQFYGIPSDVESRWEAVAQAALKWMEENKNG